MVGRYVSFPFARHGEPRQKWITVAWLRQSSNAFSSKLNIDNLFWNYPLFLKTRTGTIRNGEISAHLQIKFLWIKWMSIAPRDPQGFYRGKRLLSKGNRHEPLSWCFSKTLQRKIFREVFFSDHKKLSAQTLAGTHRVHFLSQGAFSAANLWNRIAMCEHLKLQTQVLQKL